MELASLVPSCLINVKIFGVESQDCLFFLQQKEPVPSNTPCEGKSVPFVSNMGEFEIETLKPENYMLLSRFYGIGIRMLFKRSFAAHFHAIYENNELIVGIAPLRILYGQAPARTAQLVLEWAAQHQSELLQAWQRCSRAQQPIPIAPLS